MNKQPDKQLDESAGTGGIDIRFMLLYYVAGMLLLGVLLGSIFQAPRANVLFALGLFTWVFWGTRLFRYLRARWRNRAGE